VTQPEDSFRSRQKMISPHVDILDQPDRLGSSFAWARSGFTGLLILSLLFYGVLFRHKVEQWGSPPAAAWARWW